MPSPGPLLPFAVVLATAGGDGDASVWHLAGLSAVLGAILLAPAAFVTAGAVRRRRRPALRQHPGAHRDAGPAYADPSATDPPTG